MTIFGKLAALILFLSLGVLPANAVQEAKSATSADSGLEGIALAVADVLSKAKLRGAAPQVLIWPCIEQGEVFSEFANHFPKQFSPVLLAELDKIPEVRGRARVDSGYVSGPYAPGSRSESSAARTAEAGTYNILVWGQCDAIGKEIQIQLKILQIPSERKLKSLTVQLPLTPEMEGMLRTPAKLAPIDALPVPLGQVVRENKDGYPACQYCPNPVNDCSPKLKKAIVLVRVVVSIDGRAENVSIFKGADPCLDQRAVEMVRKWKFLPAKGADGKPVAVWTTIEINFREK